MLVNMTMNSRGITDIRSNINTSCKIHRILYHIRVVDFTKSTTLFTLMFMIMRTQVNVCYLGNTELVTSTCHYECATLC